MLIEGATYIFRRLAREIHAMPPTGAHVKRTRGHNYEFGTPFIGVGADAVWS